MTSNVRIQNVRDFTVQICTPDYSHIVGMGLVVSSEGLIITCAQVVRTLGVEPHNYADEEINIYFPQARSGEANRRRATLAARFPYHDDDVVLLQLLDGEAPLGPEQIAVLGKADHSAMNPFRSYGYRSLKHERVHIIEGKIQFQTVPPEGFSLHADPIQLQSAELDRAVSGAAVLDIEHNLVVGIISENWLSDDANAPGERTTWAVNACIVRLDPFNLPIRYAPLPRFPALRPRPDICETYISIAQNLQPALHGAPERQAWWVERHELMRQISVDRTFLQSRVTMLKGAGGEGKSTLARHWLDKMLSDPVQPQPDGVFWWGFREQRSVDEFFEAALAYLSNGRPRRTPSANMRAQVLGATLQTGRYLFVLDGLEVVQHHEGDFYGLLTNTDMRDFLRFFAADGHESFCLVTSRIPLLDLVGYTSCSHRTVERLSPDESNVLLRQIGVVGHDTALDRMAAEWNGHALSLRLLATCLDKTYGGTLCISDMPLPTSHQSRGHYVHQVLTAYDATLTEAQRMFLTIFSAFRRPIPQQSLDTVFRAKNLDLLNAPINALDNVSFHAMVSELVQDGILSYHAHEQHYTMHPLVRAHYATYLEQEHALVRDQIHTGLKEYYLGVVKALPWERTLTSLKPLIETVYHACSANTYDEAHHIYREHLELDSRHVLVYQSGAYETGLALMQAFFPAGDLAQEPGVNDPTTHRDILNGAGFCLMNLGRLSEAVPLFERSVDIALKLNDWYGASVDYQHLAMLHAHLGLLASSTDAARNGLQFAHRVDDKSNESEALAQQAWISFLCGHLEAARAAFTRAETLITDIHMQDCYLYGTPGVWHADYQRRIGKTEYARLITESNLRNCEVYDWPDDLSRSYRVLADLESESGNYELARAHYDQAVTLARDISNRPALIEALLARGYWEVRLGDIGAARSDLDEALDYALAAGYRIYETDARTYLAWLHLTAGDKLSARAEALRSKRMSSNIGYYWGQVDTEKVLRKT
jgi:tetratricopeptide (TPR) repeat protein